jgi:hypothetical protein
MGVRLSVVIPTLGRPSLADTLASCADADEIVVVLDTARGTVELPCPLPPNAVFAEGSFGVTGGHAGRVHGIGLATGTHLAFMDDDDIYLPDAIDLMRTHACDRPVIFRMDHYNHGILWRDRTLEFGNVSTQMYVVPNDPGRLGSWEPHVPGLKEPGGDYTFIASTVEKMGDPVWREEIVAKLRPSLPTVAIVTPWLNHLELIPDYASTVQRRSHRDELIVVDNASEPAVGLPGLRVEENLGFATACNLGLQNASSDAVLFLNNDVAMTRPDWLAKLRGALESGVLVGAELRYDPHGMVDGRAFPYLDGWCLAGMRDDLVELGGFDESFDEPAYYSDNDLSLRARAAGMSLRAVRVGLQHKLNVTAGHTEAVSAATVANRERFMRRARELVAA